MIFDPKDLAHQEAYKLIVGTVLPRPIAFVSTKGPNGVDNLAPFSFFSVVCARPLTISLAIMRRGPEAAKKDTLVNLESTGEFVVNVVDESFVEAMNLCSADFAPDESEFAACGLTPVPSTQVAPMRVAESPIQLECRVRQVVEISAEPGGGSLVIGEVVRVHVADGLYENGKILTERWRPLGRMAGATYTRCTDTFDLARPEVPLAQQEKV